MHHGITNLDFQQADPEVVLDLWHRHWGIENQGYWVLDMVFGEDHPRARKAHLLQTLSPLRRVVITLLRLFGREGVTCTRARLSANVDQALSLVGLC